MSTSARAKHRAPSIRAARVCTGPSLLSQRASSASQWVDAGLTWENLPSPSTTMTAGPSSVAADDAAHPASTPARMPVARAPAGSPCRTRRSRPRCPAPTRARRPFARRESRGRAGFGCRARRPRGRRPPPAPPWPGSTGSRPRPRGRRRWRAPARTGHPVRTGGGSRRACRTPRHPSLQSGPGQIPPTPGRHGLGDGTGDARVGLPPLAHCRAGRARQPSVPGDLPPHRWHEPALRVHRHALQRGLLGAPPGSTRP